MQIEMRESNMAVSESLRAHVGRKLDLATRRFVGRVEGAVVRIVDLNGPRGGVDKRCRITVRLAEGAGSFVVEAIEGDPYAAVTVAAGRVDERISRVSSRRRMARTGRRARAETVRIPHEPLEAAPSPPSSPSGRADWQR